MGKEESKMIEVALHIPSFIAGGVVGIVVAIVLAG
jgi:hypothetical protein